MNFRLSAFAIAIALGLSPASTLSVPSFSAVQAIDMQSVKAGTLEISGFWTRAMLPAQPAAGGFLTVTNTGKEDDRMISVTTTRAGKSEIHEMAIIDNVMKMRQLADGLVIPAGGTVELKPGGFHLMFLEVPERFEEGQTVPVTLTFEKAGKVDLVLPVKSMQEGKMQMDHSKMDHGQMPKKQ